MQSRMLNAQVGRDITAFVKTNSNTMTPEQEREMVRKYESGKTQISLDLKYNINKTLNGKIIRKHRGFANMKSIIQIDLPPQLPRRGTVASRPPAAAPTQPPPAGRERGRRRGCGAAVRYCCDTGEQPPGRRLDTASARWTGSPTRLQGGGAAPPPGCRPDTAPARGAGSPTQLQGCAAARCRPPAAAPTLPPPARPGADY